MGLLLAAATLAAVASGAQAEEVPVRSHCENRAARERAYVCTSSAEN